LRCGASVPGSAGGGSQVVALGALVLGVGAAGLAGAAEFGDLADRDVPPAVGGRVGAVDVGLDVHHGGRLGGLGPLDPLAQLLEVLRADHLGAEAGGVGGQVHRERAAVEQAAAGGAVPVGGAEPLRAEPFGER